MGPPDRRAQTSTDDTSAYRRGVIDERLDNLAKALADQAKTISEMQTQNNEMGNKMTKLTAQVGAWSAIGGLAGAGIVSVIVAVVSGGGS